MKKINDPFISILPSLDVHGMDKQYCIFKVKEFINDNLTLKNNKIVIIHGKGKDILRKEIHLYLKSNKQVISFQTDNFNDGVTVIELIK